MAILSAKSGASGATESLISKYAKKSTDSLNHLTYTIIGNSGDGKTVTALKLSPNWSTTKLLSDVVLIAYDNNAANCVAQYGVTLDAVIDVPHIMAEEGITDVRVFEKTILFPMLDEYRKAGRTLFVFDTITERAKKHLYAIDQSLKTNDAGEKNKLDMWTRATGEMANFATDVLSFPGVTKVFTAHSAVKEGKPMGDAEAKRIATLKKEHSDPDRSVYGLDIPGKIGDVFINAVDVCFYVRTRVDPKARRKEFFALVASGLGYRTKSKFEQFIGEGEHPADLGAIEATIRAGIKSVYEPAKGE